MERGKRQAWSSFFGSTGFYIALLLCVVVAGIAGLFALLNRDGEEETTPPAVEANQPDTAVTAPPVEVSGVEEEHREAFSQRFEEAFGPDARLAPQNLVDKRKLEVRTPDVKIQVDPQRGDLVETRIIDGVGYVLIRAEGGVEVNGVPVRFSQED